MSRRPYPPWPSRRTAGMRAGSRNCCEWDGIARCIASRYPTQEVRALLAARKQMQIKAMDLEQTLRCHAA